MTFASINLPAGIERNATPYDTPNRWWDMNLIRWQANTLKPVGGWQRSTQSPLDTNSRYINVYRNNSNARHIMVGTDAKLYTDIGGIFTDITPTSFIPLTSIGAGGGYGTFDYNVDISPTVDTAGGSVASSAVTITIANPAVITWTGHALNVGDPVKFTTTGTLPTGLSTSPFYYVKTITTNTFTVSATYGGTEVQTTASGSGIHTANRYLYLADAYGKARSVSSPIYSPSAFWSMSNWGEDVILTANSDGRLFYYTTSTSSTKPVAITGTNVPYGVTSAIVTNERHVMAIGFVDPSTAPDTPHPRGIAWCSREDYTDWNFASTTNTAGYIDTDARTPLQRAVRVREGVLIFSQSEAYISRYVGLPFIYNAERIADTTLINPMAVATFNGKAAWMGRNGFWKYEGGFLQPLLCPILNEVFGHLDPTYGPFRSHAAHNGTFPEIWFFYPSNGNAECNRYLIWNYMEDWWAWGELGRTAVAPGETYIRPYMGGSDGQIYEHEYGWTAAGATRVGTVWAETGMLPLGNGDRGVNVTSILPANDAGASSMAITFYSRQAPEGSERTFGPYTARSSGYCDTRVNGRDVRFRVDQTTDNDWTLGMFRFNVEPGTGR